MKTNYIGYQIEQFMRDNHTTDQIAAILDLPVEQVTAVYNEYIKQRVMQKTKASNQHHQAIYAMSLHA
jgi:DNA-binding CsgD family transcriptional regulator